MLSFHFHRLTVSWCTRERSVSCVTWISCLAHLPKHLLRRLYGNYSTAQNFHNVISVRPSRKASVIFGAACQFWCISFHDRQVRSHPFSRVFDLLHSSSLPSHGGTRFDGCLFAVSIYKQVQRTELEGRSANGASLCGCAARYEQVLPTLAEEPFSIHGPPFRRRPCIQFIDCDAEMAIRLGSVKL